MQLSDINEIQNPSTTAIFFDDKPDTISPHIEYVNNIGWDFIILDSVDELIKVAHKHNKESKFFIDMHVPGELDLSKYKLTSSKSLNGSSFASSFYDGLYRNLKISISFAFILTGQPINAEATEILSALEDNNYVVAHIEKTDITAFTSKLDDILIDNAESNNTVDNDLSDNQLTMKQILAFEEILTELSDTPHQTILAAMGYRENNLDIDQKMSSFKQSVQDKNSDAETRLNFVLYIKKSLISLLGEENTNAHKQWIQSENTELENKSPIDLINTGDINSMAEVVSLLNQAVS